jgi:hypothetical protein
MAKMESTVTIARPVESLSNSRSPPSVLVRPSLAASRMAAEAGRRGDEAGVTSRLQRD